MIKLKHEIAKKTLIYRLLAYALGVYIGILSPLTIVQSFFWATLGETVSLILYYTYEHSWRRFIKRINLKKGMNIFSMEGNGKVSIEYNVLEVLDDNKFVIEVV